MKLKVVNLWCKRYYKKNKKLLYKFPRVSLTYIYIYIYMRVFGIVDF